MAYPLTQPTLSISESIDVIAASEASILQGINQIFCEDFVTPLLADNLTSGEDKLLLIGNVLNAMTSKECSIACILTNIADLLAVEKGLIPPTSSSVDPTDLKCSSC